MECHGDLVLVSCSLVKGVARIEGRAVQVQAHGRLRVAHVLHPVQANGIWKGPGGKEQKGMGWQLWAKDSITECSKSVSMHREVAEMTTPLPGRQHAACRSQLLPGDPPLLWQGRYEHTGKRWRRREN